jgi:hypothetical protein
MLDYLEQEIPRIGNIIQNSVKGGSSAQTRWDEIGQKPSHVLVPLTR